MTWLLEFIFGPAVPENPNYVVIQDIASLVPWWYSHVVAWGTALFLILLWAGHRRKTARMTPATAMRSKHRGTRRHPHLSIGSKELTASRMIYEPLATFDKDGTLNPFLAAEISPQENGGVAPDGRSVTWTLKKDVTWADGAPPAQQAR